MRKAVVVMGGRLTEEQQAELRERWGVERFSYLPSSLFQIWRSIPLDYDKHYVADYILPIFEHIMLNTKLRDVVVVRGEPVAVFLLVEQLKNFRRVCVSPVLRPGTSEHVRFREF